MTKEQFTEVFNMGRSYSNMPYGFNESMKEHWKYKDADEAFALYNVVLQSEQLPISCVNDFEKPSYCSSPTLHKCR